MDKVREPLEEDMLTLCRVMKEEGKLLKSVHEITNIRNVIATSYKDKIQGMIAAVGEVLGMSIELLKTS